jgi:1-acyl-sn-glycerol-3-phosphate acyltransferase
MNTLQASWKAIRGSMHVFTLVVTVRFIFPRLTPTQREEHIKTWSHALLAKLAIKLVVTGDPIDAGPVLLTANHISWLDIVVMMAARPCRFVAKSELQGWPVVGMLARATGTLFIARASSRDALRVVHHMAEQLRSGEVLAVFPEGTTSNGLQLLPFHANLFQAAISANAQVQPVALQFEDAAAGHTSLAPCYVDEDTLLDSVWRTLKAPPLCVRVSFGAPQHAQDRDRRTWAADIRAEVDSLRGANPNAEKA